MIDHIVVDVEIQKTIEELPNGWNDTHLMGVSCAVVYEYQTDRFRVYGPDDVQALQERLLAADRITGFNTYRFDFPVIWGLPNRERVTVLKAKSNDLLQRIWRALGLDEEEFSKLHSGWGLDVVAKGTLGVGKSGFGGDAPKWYQSGNWARLVDYCIDDVRLERDLGAFIDRYGYVVNGNTGQVLRLP
ncbi:MAG: 3'-5' exonuclease family protein [Armatimonadota bacterium]